MRMEDIKDKIYVADLSKLAKLTVLVTGGGGFLGRAIIDQLLLQGCRVRSFSRGDYPELRKLGVSLLRGDLADEAAVAAACDGCDIVFHNAAKAGIWGDYEGYYRPNVVGTESVLAACRKKGVRRLVFTSSASVVFSGGNIAGGNESLPYPERPRSPYTATKAIAERMILAADSSEIKTLSLRPHLIWGPRDNHIIPRIIAQGRSGKLRRVGEGKNMVDTTYIDNCAAAHLCAAVALNENPAASGRAYFISNGEPINLWDLVNRILRIAGVPPVKGAISSGTAHVLGGVLESVYKGLKLLGEPRMTRFVAEELSTSHWFDITAAKAELGYVPAISMEEGFKRLQAWLETNAV